MPLTEDFTFKLGDSGIVLNTDEDLPFVDVLKVSGLDNAPYRESRRDHEGTDGGFIDAEFEKARDILIEGDVYAEPEDMETFLDSLKFNFAPVRELIPFYFKAPGVEERLLFVKPLGCRYDWDQIRRIGSARVQMKVHAEDPRIYTSELIQVNIVFSEGATTGFGFDLGFDFGFGAPSGGTDGEFVVNPGNRPTPPIFTINGPCVNPSISDETYGHSLEFAITLSASETLVIDTKYKTVRLNGTVNRRNTLIGSDWFFLEPGSTFISYRAVSGSGSTLDIAYRSAWR